MLPSVSVPLGQRAEYRLDVGGGQDLVVSDFVQSYDAHLERRPAFADFERALREAPGTSVVGLIAAGALVGLALGRSKESALAGATIGGLAALAGVGGATAETSSPVSNSAAKLLAAVNPLAPPVRAASASVPLSRSRRRLP
jgi:hypothetical protein